MANDKTLSGHSPAAEHAKGFAAGIFSGFTKMAVGYPFDTIKVRMQCFPPGTYAGALDCLQKTVRLEGLMALYKGALLPTFGWMASDSLLLGSMHTYKRFLARLEGRTVEGNTINLSLPLHMLAASMAGWTVCTIITPVEHVKARLQMQKDSAPKLYSGPKDCVQKIYAQRGIPGLWHGFAGTLLFRTWIGPMFLSYELLLRQHRALPDDSPFKVGKGAANFIAGGMASNVFWIGAFPFDSVKNRLMTDDLNNPKYPTWMSAARQVWSEGKLRGVYRGFVPAILRAFPTNASALFVWETTMRLLNAEQVQS